MGNGGKSSFEKLLSEVITEWTLEHLVGRSFWLENFVCSEVYIAYNTHMGTMPSFSTTMTQATPLTTHLMHRNAN